MKKLSCRSAYLLSAAVGTVLLGAVMFGVPASAGTSSPSGNGRQPLFAPRTAASASLSKPALKKGGKLSLRLQQLSQPSLLTASVRTQAAAVGLPSSGPGSLLRAAGGKQQLVYVRVSGSVAGASAAIENAGATIVNASKRYRVVTAAVSPSRLPALGKLPVVVGVREALTPVFSSACPSGAVVSEGDSQLGANTARSTFGYEGWGVKVGILSDSYNALGDASTGVSAGELPGLGNTCGADYTTPVSVLEDDTAYGTDEGRAMLEVVHDLAPKAPLAFATADTGIYGMADNIRALRDAGAKVIADDVTYFDEPMFQKGPIDVAVDDVTSSGVSYFSSAGNENLVVGGKNVGSYEAPTYRSIPIASCPGTLSSSSYLDCHDFDSGSGVDSGSGYTLANGGYLTIDLQWAQPWDGVGTDLDLLVFDASTHALLAISNDYNSTTGVPVEVTSYENTTGAPQNVEVVIARWSGAALPRLKCVLMQGVGVTSVEHNSSSLGDVVGPTIFGHNGGPNTISVGAVPYNDPTTPEWYSSHGPVTYYYGPVSGTTPAAPLSVPLVLSKPDLAATDCAQTSFFYGTSSPYRFCGTSEAAPHAAAVAALMLQNGDLALMPPSQVLKRLKATARAVANGGTSDVVGWGLIDALSAVRASGALWGAVGGVGPTFVFSEPISSVSEAGSFAAITIERWGNPYSAVSVHVASANGTAAAGSDYTAVSEDVSFGIGQTFGFAYVPITDDVLIEGNETVSLSLSSPSAGSILGWPSTATLNIVDNDRAFAFSAAGYSINEGRGEVAIWITRSGVTEATDSVRFETANGSATAGSDYTAVNQVVSFAAGESAKVVYVPITNDTTYESDETVMLYLWSPSTGAMLGTPSTATLTIFDNGAAPPPTTPVATNPKPTSSSGKISSAHLTKTSFGRFRAATVKLLYSFSPKSKVFAYVLSIKKASKWVILRSVRKTGSFKGAYKMTVKQLFGPKRVKAGRYRLKLKADLNSRTLLFRVT